MIRYVETKDDNNNWVIRNFIEIKQGEIFRFYEPDSTLLVLEELKNTVYDAVRDAYYNSDGVACIVYNRRDNKWRS